MNKKIIFTAFIVVLFFILSVFFLRVLSGEDNWICVDGKWVSHGHPNMPMPESGCETSEIIIDKENIVIYDFEDGQYIKSPLIIKGKARGNWFFEGDFPTVLTDWDGRIIGESYATAKSDWMTEEFVDFETEIEFEKPELYDRGALILRKANPSGLAEFDDALEIQIKFE